jgi:dihydroorotate dehydrogenase
MTVPLSAAQVERPLAPTYRIDRSFEWNWQHGPHFEGPWPLVPETPMKTFFGFPVRSRFGIPPSILPTSRWVSTYSRLGFDILSYKTVRSVPRFCGSPPNWAYLDEASLGASLANAELPILVTDRAPTSAARTTTGGSFGLPSTAPDVWEDDIPRARAGVANGQVFIASIVGTATPESSEDAFVKDFGDLAGRVARLGAQIVEIDLSCPNVGKAEGMLYMNVPLCERITRLVRKAASGCPVLLKIGAIPDDDRLIALMKAIAGMAEGLVLINAPGRRIINADGTSYFGKGREFAGVTGAAIKPLALGCVKQGVRLIEQHKLPLQVVACGGIATTADIREFIAAGACAAVSATAAMFNPYMAVDLKAAAPEI